MDPQLPGSNRTKRTSHNTSNQPQPPIAQMAGLQLRRFGEGHDVEAPPSHVGIDKVFTLRVPRDESTVPHHDVPSGETDTPRSPPSCPPSTGEDFRLTAPRLSPAHGQGSRLHPASSTTRPPEEARRIPNVTPDFTRKTECISYVR
jgi:hypothetical protein